MFPSWRTAMIPAMATMAMVNAHSSLPAAAQTTASSEPIPAAINEPSETYFVVQTTRAITGTIMSRYGKSAIAAPAPVATPFPPLNPMNGDQQCPTTVATAAVATQIASNPADLAKRTGSSPFRISSSATTADARGP